MSKNVAEYFACDVFNDEVMKARLPKPVYKAMTKTRKMGTPLDPTYADVVANAIKDWAIEHGATHYTHWFQPLTGGKRLERGAPVDLGAPCHAAVRGQRARHRNEPPRKAARRAELLHADGGGGGVKGHDQPRLSLSHRASSSTARMAASVSSSVLYQPKLKRTAPCPSVPSACLLYTSDAADEL